MASSAAKDHHHVAVATQHGPGFSSSGAQPVEDESSKKNTDCVYFLASPLTCKKGSECEYRHSEYARVNPRDCWYWLNGSCLNPKCSFRHPPLDTLMGTPTDSSAGSSKPVSSSAAVGSSLPPPYTVPSAPYTAAKPTAPCIFFQKGYCLKADRCPFFHVQNPASNKAPDHPAVNVSETSRFNTASGALQKCSQLKFAPQANMPKPIEAVPQQPKTGVHVVQPVLRNGAFVEKRGMPQHNVSNQDLPKHSEITSRSLSNGSSRNKTVIASQASSRDDQRFQFSKEADDLQRESSPGFDVLVDDELGDADYFGNDDQFSRNRGHEGREPGEFESGRPDHYHSLDDFDPVAYHDRRGYDGYKPMQERRSRDSSERPIIEGSHYDRRAVSSDLRQRLSKQRRTNGSTSVVNPDYPSEKLGEERRRYGSSRRESRHTPPRGSSVSIGSRLQGRIKLPGQPSPVNPPSMHSEREYDKGRNHSRLSPNRPQLQSHRVRVQDRLRGKVQDDVGREAAAPRRDVFDYNRSEFAAPKSLAELRKSKEPYSQSRELPKRSDEFSSIEKRKALESSLNSEDNLSFDAPKPLSEILKRKRKAEDTNLHSGMATVSEVGKNTKNKEDATNKEEENKLSMPSASDVKEINSVAVDESIADISQANDVFESEEGLITDGVEVGNELGEEYYEDGEYEYDQEGEGGEGYALEEGEGGEEYAIEEGEGGEEYIIEGGEGGDLEEGEGGDLEEGENGELPEEEYMDEDDADSFAKKIGVMFS